MKLGVDAYAEKYEYFINADVTLRVIKYLIDTVRFS